MGKKSEKNSSDGQYCQVIYLGSAVDVRKKKSRCFF